jgi:hypothetical protein
MNAKIRARIDTIIDCCERGLKLPQPSDQERALLGVIKINAVAVLHSIKDGGQDVPAERRQKSGRAASTPLARDGRTERILSESSIGFAHWFKDEMVKSLLTRGVKSACKFPATWRGDWAACYDDMIEHDGRSKEDIFAVCKTIFQHDFWSRVILSPLKLRKRDKDKIMYFDRVAASTRQGKSHAEQKREHKQQAEYSGTKANTWTPDD